MVVGEDYYYSDSDDDDVDRYVFLARQPAPARRHAVEDASSDDDDVTAGEEERGGHKEKRPLREVLDDPPSSPKKKARFGLITSPSALKGTSGTDQPASSPCGVRDRESGSEESHEEAQELPDPREGKPKKNRGVRGKRSRSSPGCEDDDRPPHRDVTAAAKTGTSSAAASAGRFVYNLCDRCFDSHQALGGHVQGHRKKARIATAAAAASPDDAGGSGNKCHETKKAFADVDDAVSHEDVNKSGQAKKASVVAEDHRGVHGDGCSGTAVFASSDEGVNGSDRDEENASSHGNGNGNEETANGTGTHDAGVKNKKAAVVTCRKGAPNSGSNVVDACRSTQHKCKICGTECPTGWALGGHMRKHRKRPANGGEGEGMPATDGDDQTPIARQFAAEVCLPTALVIAGEPGDMLS